jgi:dGTPase
VGGLVTGTYRAAVEAGLQDVGQLRAHPRRVACLTPQAHSASASLKSFLHRQVYSAEVLLEERRRVTLMLAELFEYFLEHPAGLPAAYREQAADQPPHRIVCDYIAGMTDGFFHRTYRRIIQNEQ